MATRVVCWKYGELTVVTDLECAPRLACSCSSTSTCSGRLSRIGVLVLLVIVVVEIVVVHFIQIFVLSLLVWLPVWILLIGQLGHGFEVVHEGGREGSVRVVVLRAGGWFVVTWQVHPQLLAVEHDGERVTERRSGGDAEWGTQPLKLHRHQSAVGGGYRSELYLYIHGESLGFAP